MHASACCSGEISELGVHAKALEGLRSLRATTYHLLRNLTCRDYLRAWVRVRVRPRTYWGRMMPEKFWARGPRVLADSQLAPAQEAIGVG